MDNRQDERQQPGGAQGPIQNETTTPDPAETTPSDDPPPSVQEVIDSLQLQISALKAQLTTAVTTAKDTLEDLGSALDTDDQAPEDPTQFPEESRSITLIVGIFVGIGLALPLVLGFRYAGDVMGTGVTVTIIVATTVSASATLLYASHRWLLKKAEAHIKTTIHELAKPIAQATGYAITAQPHSTVTSVLEFARGLLLWNAKRSLRAWIVGAVVALLATVAGIFGSHLVNKQNKLIAQELEEARLQNTLTTKQLAVVEEELAEAKLQTGLIEVSNTLTRDQNNFLREQNDFFRSDRINRQRSRKAELLKTIYDDRPCHEDERTTWLDENLKLHWAILPAKITSSVFRRHLKDVLGLHSLANEQRCPQAGMRAREEAVRALVDIVREGNQRTVAASNIADQLKMLFNRDSIVHSQSTNVNLRNANLSRLLLNKIELQGARLWYANLQFTKLQHAKLQNIKFKGANLQGADLQLANLKGAYLKNANLKGAMLISADLQGADLQGINLRGANLANTNLQGTKNHGANLQEAILANANLQGTQLWEVNLQGAFLYEADLQGADLILANLQGASLDGANLEGANLEGANLKGAYLYGTNLQRADLEFANLEGANLEFANLKGADLTGADLSGAKIQRAKFQGARYTKDTIWPNDFDPKQTGAILVDNSKRPITVWGFPLSTQPIR